MTDQRHKIQSVLVRRISVVQAIAAANCEQLRLNQIASGMLILDLKDDEDGTDIGASSAERSAHDAALEACATKIETLEADLALLDRELAAITESEHK